MSIKFDRQIRTDDELHDIALIYKKDLEIRFPEYGCTLVGSILGVHTKRSSKTVLSAYFTERYLKTIRSDPGRHHIETIDYTDPRFTEDILVRMLIEYQNHPMRTIEALAPTIQIVRE